jgi:biotin operon repressor
MTTTTQLLNALASHQGRDNGIAAQRLADQLQVPPRRLRKLISAAREDGIAICGKPRSGYFMPVTPQELQETCEFLEHRALHSLRKLSRMKQVALPVLLGQLALNQA